MPTVLIPRQNYTIQPTLYMN